MHWYSCGLATGSKICQLGMLRNQGSRERSELVDHYVAVGVCSWIGRALGSPLVGTSDESGFEPAGSGGIQIEVVAGHHENLGRH